jgi:hypothetical protein
MSSLHGARVETPQGAAANGRKPYERDWHMTEQNTQDQGTQDQANTSANGAVDTPAKMYPTKETAEASRPTDAPKSLKPMEVSKGGTVVGWVLARGYDHGLSIVARIDGYTVSTGKAVAVVSKEMVSAKVLEMSDDEFKQLVQARKAAAKKS